MNQNEIREAIRRIKGKITPGPWKVYTKEMPYDIDGLKGVHIEHCIGTEHEHPQLGSPAPVVTMASGIGMRRGETIQYVHIDEADAELIAMAPEIIPLAEAAAGLQVELDRYEQAHETVHEKFGFINDGTGECACAYCKGDAETLMNMCAYYEMENDRLKKELGTLKEDDKFVCMRCDKEMIAELAELKIEKEDLKEKIVGLEAELQHIKGITAEEWGEVIKNSMHTHDNFIAEISAAIVARIKGEA